MIICYNANTGSGCGHYNPTRATFCAQCGTQLRGSFLARDPGEIVNSWQIQSIIGHGAFGVVYRAVHVRSGQEAALKETFESSHIISFQSEFAVLYTMQHPNLPHYLAMFEVDAKGYLVMEYVPGQSLEDVLRRRNQPLLESQVLGYALQLCDALTYLHSRNPPIVHRDVKPANVRLTPDGLIKLVDFGLFKQGLQATARSRLALTPAYAPIEQWGGVQRTDPRSDVYSLGATLYHCLTGVEPSQATDRISSDVDTLVPIQQRNPSISEPVDAAITKALALRSLQRHADAAAFKQALQGHRLSLISTEASVAVPAPSLPRGAAHAASAPAQANGVLPKQEPLPAGRAAVAVAALPSRNPLLASTSAPAAHVQMPQPVGAIPPAPPAAPMDAVLPGVTRLMLCLSLGLGLFTMVGLITTQFGLILLSYGASLIVASYIAQHKGRKGFVGIVTGLLMGPLAVSYWLIAPPLVNGQRVYQAYQPARANVLVIGTFLSFLLAFVHPGLIVLFWTLAATVAEYIYVSKSRRCFEMFVVGIFLAPLALIGAALVRPSTVAQRTHP